MKASILVCHYEQKDDLLPFLSSSYSAKIMKVIAALGRFLLSVFTMPDVSSSGAAVTPFVPDLKSSNDGKISVLGDFMSTYQQVINHGASVITPICIRILLILTVIEASWELSFKLISGDKIKYLLSLSIKVGFIIFLLENWVGGMGLMTALSQGFETMGLMAGGTTADVSPDNIVNNAISIFSVFWDKAHFNSLGLLVVNCVSVPADNDRAALPHRY